MEKLICTDTGKWTRITCSDGNYKYEDVLDAMNRLIKRELGAGHYFNDQCAQYGDFDNGERFCVMYANGSGLSERCNETREFKIVK